METQNKAYTTLGIITSSDLISKFIHTLKDVRMEDQAIIKSHEDNTITFVDNITVLFNNTIKEDKDLLGYLTDFFNYQIVTSVEQDEMHTGKDFKLSLNLKLEDLGNNTIRYSTLLIDEITNELLFEFIDEIHSDLTEPEEIKEFINENIDMIIDTNSHPQIDYILYHEENIKMAQELSNKFNITPELISTDELYSYERQQFENEDLKISRFEELKDSKLLFISPDFNKDDTSIIDDLKDIDVIYMSYENHIEDYSEEFSKNYYIITKDDF